VRERWATPDGDFIDVDHFSRRLHAPGAPLLVLFHGLEGSRSSHYAQAFASVARQRGWAFSVPHFRGCSGELNRAPRAYHSGDFRRDRLDPGAAARAQRGRRCCVVGVSLGGNALLRWAQEAGDSARPRPARWPRCARPSTWRPAAAAIDRGFNRQVYTRMFLRTMKPKALAKWQQHPGLFDRERLPPRARCTSSTTSSPRRCTASRTRQDYWARASAKPHLARMRIPALVLNARNDPFVPAASLPGRSEVGPRVSRCGSRRMAATWAFRMAAFPAMCWPCRRPWPTGWRALA
jgi:predicted alpha/beta-fold hydrolase